MKKIRFLHLVVLLSLLLAATLQPANGQAKEPVPAPAEGSTALENLSTTANDGQITPLTMSLAGGPDYDSSWVSISQGQTVTFTHNLGLDTNYYWVDLEYKNSGLEGINKAYYGGADISGPNRQVGIYWRNLTTSSIRVTRRTNDTYAEKVRVRIWIETPPSYLSHWYSLQQGIYYTFVITDPDKYLFDLRFNDSNSNAYGINQRFYGGKDCLLTSADCVQDAEEGANWYFPSTNVLWIFRQRNDTSLGAPGESGDQFHLQVWELPKATYVSQWQDIPKGGDYSFTHGIGGNADDYVVDLEYKSNNPDIGINQIYYGGAQLGAHTSRPFPVNSGSPGDLVGAYWNGLTNSTISVHRNPDDLYADQVRVRIWNFWKPPKADYVSSWFIVGKGASVNPPQPINIPGGDAKKYLVDLQFKNSSEGINQHNYGMNELGAKLDQGHTEDNVGAYWKELTTNSITITRAPQDATVEQARVRIWNMPKPDFDSNDVDGNWVSISPGSSNEIPHNLGGFKGNYLVDVQFKSTQFGINQGGFGGFDTGTQSFTGLATDKQVGAYWTRLTNSSITVVRRANDIFAEQVRVRIWRMANPNYDSGMVFLPDRPIKTFTHSLNQDPDKFFISTTFSNGESQAGYNLAFYGGGDLANNDRLGAYWYGLTPRQILVYQRTEDPYANVIQVRIWVTEFTTYIPITRKH